MSEGEDQFKELLIPLALPISRRRVSSIARRCQIQHVDELHQTLERISGAYWLNKNIGKLPDMRGRREEARQLFGTLNKVFQRLNPKDSELAKQVLMRTDQEIKLKAIRNSDLTEGASMYVPSVFDFLSALHSAKEHVQENAVFTAPKTPKGMPKNLGIRITLQNLENYWLSRDDLPKPRKYKYNCVDDGKTPNNNATWFTLFSLRAIDTSLERGTILSHMKKFTMPKYRKG